MSSSLTWTIFLVLSACFRTNAGTKVTSLTQKHERLDSRSDDMNSMEVVQEQHSQKLQEFETRLAAMETKYTVELNALKANCRAEVSSLRSRIEAMSVPLVFTAEHGTSRDYRGGDIIHFTHVIINIGNMYDDVTGVVSVPQHGVYSIYVRTDPPYGLNVYDDLELKVNGGHIINAIAEQGTLGSVFVSLQLEAHDKVWVAKRVGSQFASSVGPASAFSVVRVSP